MRKLADDGDERAAAALRRSQEHRPDLWDRHRRTTGEQACESWLLLYGGDTPDQEYTRTVFRHDADRLREELLGGSSDALDRLMVDRIVVASIAANYHDSLYAQAAKSGTTFKNLNWHAQRAAAANRTFLQACESFARVRRLRGPAVAVNIGAVNLAAAPASPAATSPSALPEPDPEAATIEGAWRPAGDRQEEPQHITASAHGVSQDLHETSSGGV